MNKVVVHLSTPPYKKPTTNSKHKLNGTRPWPPPPPNPLPCSSSSTSSSSISAPPGTPAIATPATAPARIHLSPRLGNLPRETVPRHLPRSTCHPQRRRHPPRPPRAAADAQSTRSSSAYASMC
ncbi:hypothetical protein HPP92_022131 [Vanilla planifolia]|uniref:Uncharacterized protein n=1 Tax=Vanilla planifolia TaxID=51239 RepID=A0A835PXM3_VANPL|nr:hypothetical protein HPP92_022131 [Vanilla planifolia]